MAIGFGEPWKFNNKFINKYKGKLIDFMLYLFPFLEVVHYTWMSLMSEKKGAVCLQEITTNTLQGVFDDGKYLKKTYNIKENSKPQNFDLERKNTNLLLKYSLIK